MHQQTTHVLTPERLSLFASMLREQQLFRREQIRGFTGSRAFGSPAEIEIDSVVRHGARTALAEIEAALARIEHGTYGRCTTCGTAISIERLEILPQTARCIDCERRR